jgi:hypothetical protein
MSKRRSTSVGRLSARCVRRPPRWPPAVRRGIHQLGRPGRTLGLGGRATPLRPRRRLPGIGFVHERVPPKKYDRRQLGRAAYFPRLCASADGYVMASLRFLAEPSWESAAASRLRGRKPRRAGLSGGFLPRAPGDPGAAGGFGASIMGMACPEGWRAERRKRKERRDAIP